MGTTRSQSTRLLALAASVGCLLSLVEASGTRATERGRPLLVTVDDLPLNGGRRISDPAERRRITEEMLAALEAHGIRAVALVTWQQVETEADRRLLELWLDGGHEMGNHSYSHPSYSRTTVDAYIADVERARQGLADFLASQRPSKRLRFFRFPFLRQGDTPEKLEAMRQYLHQSGQRNLPVTLDNQDWSFEVPWLEAVRAGDEAAAGQVAEAYHEAIHVSIRHHEAVGETLFDRPVPEILLLHAMAVSAAQWDRLFTWLEEHGYRFASADEVLADPALNVEHAYVGPLGLGRWDRLLDQRRRRQALAEVEAVLVAQTAAWNRGDLEAFCADYDEDTVFVSPSGISRGRQQVLERYRERYPDRAAQGVLELEILETSVVAGTEVSMLGDARPGSPQGATIVARWTLDYPLEADRQAASGLTLLVFERRAGGWKIVRDASM